MKLNYKGHLVEGTVEEIKSLIRKNGKGEYTKKSKRKMSWKTRKKMSRFKRNWWKQQRTKKK